MKTQKSKRTFKLTLGLVLGLLVGLLPGAAFADTKAGEGPNQPGGAAVSAECFGQLKGAATVEPPLADGQLLVSVEGQKLALNVSPETLSINAQTGIPAALGELMAGDKIFVYYSAAMTRSLPPQAQAKAIVTGLQEGGPTASFMTVREIISRSDSQVRVLNKEGDLIVTLLKENPLSAYKTKQGVTLGEIAVGTQLFVWYDIVAMSYPGQTAASKAVYAGQEEGLGVRAVYTPMAGAKEATLLIKGKPIQLGGKSLMDQHGYLMVPLRSVAQGLGFRVVWNSQKQSIRLDDGSVSTSLVLGEDSYAKASSQAIGLTQGFSLGAAPTLLSGQVYVPAALFNLLYSDNEAVALQ